MLSIQLGMCPENMKGNDFFRFASFHFEQGSPVTSDVNASIACKFLSKFMISQLRMMGIFKKEFTCLTKGNLDFDWCCFSLLIKQRCVLNAKRAFVFHLRFLYLSRQVLLVGF